MRRIVKTTLITLTVASSLIISAKISAAHNLQHSVKTINTAFAAENTLTNQIYIAKPLLSN